MAISAAVSTQMQKNQVLGTSEEDKQTKEDPNTFQMAMRDLWVDHVVYTRLYIVSFANSLNDTSFIANRLLKNQEEIGNAIKPFYGDAAGDKLTSLLKQHIVAAVDVLKAAKAGNTTALKLANATWYQNADDIATFLSNANPKYFHKNDLMMMLDNHLKLTTDEAVARLSGNYPEDIASFDKVRMQANLMADMLSEGIMKQFPNKFVAQASI